MQYQFSCASPKFFAAFLKRLTCSFLFAFYVLVQNAVNLNVSAPCISESCIKIKLGEIFIFILLCKAPQRSVKMKFQVNFFSSSKIGTGKRKGFIDSPGYLLFSGYLPYRNIKQSFDPLTKNFSIFDEITGSTKLTRYKTIQLAWYAMFISVISFFCYLFKSQPYKMVKHTQTVRRLLADELFEGI